MSGPITRRIRTWAAALVAVTGTATMQAHADTFYVNGSCGDDAWTGTSSVCAAPNGPKRTIQAGIDSVVNGDEVVVADGTYSGLDNKDLDFAGKLITVRSANGPANCTIDCEGVGRGFIFQKGETDQAVVEGFTIQNGNSGRETGGGGMLCVNSSPKVINCAFLGNRTFGPFGSGPPGGGLLAEANSSPTVTNCIFRLNEASVGGGMANDGTSSPTVTNCTFSDNVAVVVGFGGCGGGMFNGGGSPTVTNCTFSDNASALGGGMYNVGGTPTVANCTFSRNEAEQNGGAIFGSVGTFANCIVWGNSSTNGVAEIFGTPTVTYSDVRGGFVGEGNIDDDPLFFDPAGGDYHLSPGSPCIDAGDPAFVPQPGETDVDGQKRVWNGRVDMGSDEFGSFAFGDLNCDGAINGGDIDPFFLALGDPAAYALAFPNCDPLLGDMNSDGRLDGGDIDPFFGCLGGGVCP